MTPEEFTQRALINEIYTTIHRYIHTYLHAEPDLGRYVERRGGDHILDLWALSVNKTRLGMLLLVKGIAK